MCIVKRQGNYWVHGELDTFWSSDWKSAEIYGAAVHNWEGYQQEGIREDLRWLGVYIWNAAHPVAHKFVKFGTVFPLRKH